MKKIGILMLSAWCFVTTAQEPVVPPSPEPLPVTPKEKAFRPGAIWQDDKEVHINAHGGGLLFHDGVYYWYGEHKVAGGAGNVALVGVHVYSSTNLYNWQDRGVALAVTDNPESPIVKGCVIERPKVIYNATTHKFVMWFHLELKGKGYSAAQAGVAASDSATGPFTFIRALRPNAGKYPANLDATLRQEFVALQNQEQRVAWGKKHGMEFWARDFEKGQMARDMNLYLDDDGKAYLLFASEENQVLHISRLTSDFQEHTGEYIRAFGGSREAPAPFKSKGRYFMFNSGCTGWAPNPARVYTADSLLGEWRNMGECFDGPRDLARISYDSQSTYVLPVAGRNGAFIYLADRWRPRNAADGRYIWLPVRWNGDKPRLGWLEQWDLSVFDKVEYVDPGVMGKTDK